MLSQPRFFHREQSFEGLKTLGVSKQKGWKVIFGQFCLNSSRRWMHNILKIFNVIIIKGKLPCILSRISSKHKYICSWKVADNNFYYYLMGAVYSCSKWHLSAGFPADRYNAALVCCRWRHLASDPRMWLRVDKSDNALPEPGVFKTIEDAVIAARPGDTILIAAGAEHMACNIQINKPLCLVGGGSVPDDTVLACPRGYDSALEFLAAGKVCNLTIKAELGSCLLHRNGRLTVENCMLQCEEHPLEHLCCPIVSTAEALPSPVAASSILPYSIKGESSVSVIHTRIEGGAKAVITKGSLTLQQVRVIYARTALFFWFNVAQKRLTDLDMVPFACKA